MSGCSVDYPIYGIAAIDSAQVALCGGGGSMKSGVSNTVEVYSTRGKGMVLSYRYDCERAAPTCMAVHPGEPIIAVGVDHNLLILEVEKPKQIIKKQIPSLKKVLQREVVRVTDKGEIVKSIAFCCFGEKLVTVGEDNGITIWEFPSMVRRWRINQHLSEVTQVTGHSMGEPEIVTATRGSECFVWDVETAAQTQQLKYNGIAGVKYRFRNIKYGAYGKTFYAVVLPVAWTKSALCHVLKYDTENWSISCETYLRGEPLAELAVSPDDSLIATASSNGHVYIYDSYSLGLRRTIRDAHGLFITGLTFMRTIDSDQFKLLSISADHECKIHNPHIADPIRFLKALVIALLIIGFLYISFLLLNSFDMLPHIDDFDDNVDASDHHHHAHNEL